MATALSYQHIAPELRVFHGEHSLRALQRELARAGARRAMVICGRTIGRSEALAQLREALGDTLVAVAPVAQENSPVAGVQEAARSIEAHAADAIIAVGGGSAVVSARAAAILVGEGQPLRELSTRRLPDGQFHSPRLNAPKLPLFVVPTTPSNAFAKAGTAVHDADGTRLALFDPKTRARAIFIHPAFAITAPEALARTAGLNALANAVEALESPGCDPLSEALLMQALRLLRLHLPRLGEPGSAAREQLVVAGILCGRGTEQGGAGLSSVLAHAIGHRAHVANGVVSGIVLPHTMRYNAPVTHERAATILDSMGTHQQPDAASAVAAFLNTLGTPTQLREIGLAHADLPAIADAAMQDWFIGRNARPVRDAGALLALLEAAW